MFVGTVLQNRDGIFYDCVSCLLDRDLEYMEGALYVWKSWSLIVSKGGSVGILVRSYL